MPQLVGIQPLHLHASTTGIMHKKGRWDGVCARHLNRIMRHHVIGKDEIISTGGAFPEQGNIPGETPAIQDMQSE